MKNYLQQKNDKKRYPIIFFFGIAFLLIVGGEIYRVTTLNFLYKNGVYTIGTLKNIRRTGRNYLADCFYTYKGKAYNCQAGSDEISPQDENKPAIILLYPKRPNFKRRFENYYIPDTITYIPQEGWKELPSYIYKKE